jgi:hypothetical protein
MGVSPPAAAPGGRIVGVEAEPIQGAAPQNPAPRWTVTEGIAAPESAYFDEASGFIFSSQIDGAPDARDGNGRIVKIGADGKLVSANWATGLNAPKGLRGCRGTLWTADIDEVVGFDIASGKQTSRLKIDGAQFLNDVACGGDGTVYVSDMLASRIYSVANGKATVFADGESLEYPNGLLVAGNRLIVGGWGKPEADFTTKVPGRLFALDLKSKQKTAITPQPFANIDGVESDGAGGFLVSDYLSGRVHHVLASGQSRVLLQFAAGAADLGFVPATRTVVMPHMNDNRVAAYDVSALLK